MSTISWVFNLVWLELKTSSHRLYIGERTLRENVLEFMRAQLPQSIEEAIKNGEFSSAQKLIENLLARTEDETLRKRLLFELDRLERWKLEYPYAPEEAYNKLKKEIENLSLDEFNRLVEEGCIDHARIDGQIRVFRRFVPNSFWLCPRLKARRKKGIDERRRIAGLTLKWRAERVIEASKKTGEHYVLPILYRVRMELEIDSEKAPRDKKMRVWLLLPQVSELHPEVKLLDSEPKPVKIADPNEEQRTVYFELEPGQHRVWMEYEYVSRGFHVEVDPEQVYVDEESEIYRKYTAERPPHIVFTPYLRGLAEKIVGGEKNPYMKVKRIWDWITTNVRYTYAMDYALYDNISEYVARKKRGDCGMQALLFITLTRIAGVPARWQSGWYMNPVLHGMHDWAQFYIEPYGWLYVDPSFGNKHKEDWQWRNKFYLGSIDGYRLAANTEVNAQFDPPKVHVRSDPVDNQRGEVETSTKNLYYNLWRSRLEIKEVYSLE